MVRFGQTANHRHSKWLLYRRYNSITETIIVVWWHYLVSELWVNAGSGNGFFTRRYQTNYRKTAYISRTLVGNKIVDNSDVAGASPVGAAPTTSELST